MNNREVYILEVDGNLTGVYENKGSAQVEGILAILNDPSEELTYEDKAEIIKEFLAEDYVDCWVYIYKKPFYGDLG
jgi:hypothetical protein